MCPAQAFGQVHQLKCLQPLDVFQHVPRVGFQRCLAQPGQPGDAAAGLELQQLVQLGPMRVREWFDQGAVDPPIGSRNGFRAGRSITLSAGRMRRFCRRLSGPDRPAASLCRSAGPARLARAPGRGSRQAERGQLQVGAQFLACSRRVTSRSPYFAQLAGSAWTCFATHRMTGSGSSLSVPSA